MIKIYHGECLNVISKFKSGFFDLIYIDPPFNTGKKQRRNTISYDDTFEDFGGFIKPRLEQAYRILKSHGSFFLHIDYRESHYCKIMLDKIFGRGSFMNEIIWAYDYGARSKKRWSTKHDTIFWYAKNPENYTFNYDKMDRIPYMTPNLVGPEKAKRGKTPTDVWWQTIVSTVGKEKTGYPTQKPIAILDRIIKIHSNPGDTVLDFFAGSGTTGESAFHNGRKVVLVDNNDAAINIMKNRFNMLPVIIRRR